MGIGSQQDKNLNTARHLVAEGRYLDAAKAFRIAGDYERAGEMALKGGDSVAGVHDVVQGALGHVSSVYQDATPKIAGDLLFADGKYPHAELLYSHSGDFKKAAECALKLNQEGLAARYYESAEMWAESAIYYEAVGNFEHSLRILDRERQRLKEHEQFETHVPTLKKSAYDLDLRRAHLLEKVGKIKESASLLEELGLPRQAARLYFSHGKFAESIEIYSRAGAWKEAFSLIAETPKFDQTKAAEIALKAGKAHEAGVIYEGLGDPEKAAEAYEASEEWKRAANLWEKVRQHRKAAAAWQHLDRYSSAARCWAASGEFGKAALAYSKKSKYRAAAENYLRGHQPLLAAEFFLKCKDKIAAQNALFQIPVDDKDFEASIFLLAPLLIEVGQHNAALQRLKLLPKSSEDSPERTYLEARALEGLGDEGTAGIQYRKLLNSHENFRDAEKRLNNIQKRTTPKSAVEIKAVKRPLAQKHEMEHIDVGSILESRYEILELVGQGGMGKVFRAKDRQLQEEIAIKTLIRPEKKDSGEEKRLLQEVRICHRISHPNVVRVYDIGRAGKELFITMEYLDGTSLEGLVTGETINELDRIHWIIGQVVAGLSEAHTLGVIHRDLKPANIFVLSQRIKILDFGIARAGDIDSKLTKTGFAMGSPRYMSPEQLQGDKLDTRSDLYSLGILTFALIAGREPFIGPNVTRIMLDHIGVAPPDLRSFRPTLPEPWIDFVEKLLCKNRDERFQTAEEIEAAMRELPLEEDVVEL